MFSCKNYEKELSAFIDDELSESKRRKIASHLSGCRKCSDLLEELRSNNLALGQLFSKKNIPGAEKGRKDFSAMMERIYEKERDEPIEVGQRVFDALKNTTFEKIDAILEMVRFSGSAIDIKASPAGEAVSGSVGRLIPALLIGLAIILFYAPKLNALLIINYS